MSKPKPTIAVVMPTFERRELLPRVLSPLLKDPEATEVIVVNDGGRDGSVRLLDAMKAQAERLTVIDLARSGREAARRAGIEAASADVILLVDDDVEAEPGLVGRHADAHAAGEGDVMEGYMPVCLGERRRPGQSATYLYAAEYEEHCTSLESGQKDTLFALWGGNVSLPRELALGATSGPDFPTSFGEDTHFGLKCHRLGARGVFSRGLRATHLHRRTLPQFSENSYQLGASRWWLHYLHGDLLGPADPASFLDGVPQGLASRLGRVPPSALGRLTATAMRAAGLTGSAHLFALETAATRVLRRASARRGFVEAATAQGTPSAK